MFTFQVNDMTCGHCPSAITKAVLAVDSRATVDVDLGQQMVHVDTSNAADEAIRQAIQAAGYQPVAVKATSGRPEVQRSGGCCCARGATSATTWYGSFALMQHACWK